MFELGRAAWNGDVTWVKTLLREGVQVSSRDSRGRTALHYACESEHEDMQRVVDVLLDAGADVNAQDEDEQTPLHVAVQRVPFQTKLENNAAGGEIEEKTLAISSKRNEVLVKTLLREGALVNARDRKMLRTALHWACTYIRGVYEDELLEAEADTKNQDEKGLIPLHVAIVNNEIIKALLANITNESSKERSSQHLVDHPEDEEKVRMVNSMDRYCDTALHTACKRSGLTIVDCVCQLLSAGAKVGVKNNCGMTHLHMAAHYSKADIVDILLNNGEDVNATGNWGNTPLHVASEGGQTETVRLLYRKGAKVGVKNAMGKTPLHTAAALAAGDIVDVLVDHGEYVRAKDRFGNTPLHHVGDQARFKCINDGEIAFIINFLIIRGAKIDEQNIHGETPHEQIKARQDDRMKTVETTLITQTIRLKALWLQDKFDINWIFGPDFYDDVKIRCCQELERMKYTMVMKDISLYQVLSHISQSFLVSTEDLQHIDEFLSSPDLLTRFPLYGDTLRITFQRAKLLPLAVQSFYSEQRKQMVKKLPCEVTEHLVTFLSNEDLRNFIKSEYFE